MRSAGTGGRAIASEAIPATLVMSDSRKGQPSSKNRAQEPKLAQMVLNASGRRGDTVGTTIRELGCRNHKKCENCKEGARDLEEIREHKCIEHK